MINLFSKEKLFKLVGLAKRHWWLFAPVLLIMMLGYFVCYIADAIHILLLHIRNFLLTIIMLMRRCISGIGRCFTNTFKAIGAAFSRRHKKTKESLNRMSENAATARNQLLNGAVEYCSDKMQQRQDKKQHLKDIAQELKSNTHISKDQAIATNTTGII